MVASNDSCIYSIYLEEARTSISLTVQRTLGTFGRVSVFAFAQQKVQPADGATRGQDFDFEAQVRFLAILLSTLKLSCKRRKMKFNCIIKLKRLKGCCVL